MDAKKLINNMEYMVNSLQNIGSRLNELQGALQGADLEYNRLSHEKELIPMSDPTMTQHFLKERDVLRIRRTIKDEIMLLERFKDFYNENSKLKFALIETIKDMHKTVVYQNSRKYVPKERNNTFAVTATKS